MNKYPKHFIGWMERRGYKKDLHSEFYDISYKAYLYGRKLGAGDEAKKTWQGWT